MKIVPDSPRRAYINVMELLVAEEVEQQLKDLPPRVIKYLKVVEVETYALNRLPALYASSEKGWRHQYEKAKRELHNQIKSAVRQAFAAVQVDPLRSSAPLQVSTEDEASGVLESLRDLLKQPDLGWDGVVSRLRDLIHIRSADWDQAPAPDLKASHRSRYRPMPGDRSAVPPSLGNSPAPASGAGTPGSAGGKGQGQHWRPGTYGVGISWRQRNPDSSPPQKDNDFDWNDPRYSR